MLMQASAGAPRRLSPIPAFRMNNTRRTFSCSPTTAGTHMSWHSLGGLSSWRSRDPHELAQPRGLGGLHTEMEAQTLPDMSSLASTGTAIGAISATSFAVTSPAHCCDSLEGFGRHSEATGTADVPRRPRSKSCSIRRRSRGSRISLLKTEKEIEQLMLGSGDTGNNRTIAFLRSLSRQVETADASGSQQSHLERAGSGHGGSRASQDALGFSHPSVPDVDHLCVSTRASEETQDELEEPVPWSFDIFVTLLKPGEHERSPLVVLISNSTQHLQVQSTLSALAESQLELLSSLMPQHAVQFLALESTEAVPRHVAELARAHKGVTLLFMDIVGFTSMSKNVEPVDVMVFLNTLFSVFDQLTDIHGVHKVETAGDCYIVSGGIMSSSKQSTKEFGLVVEDQDPKESAMRVMGFAKAILDAAQQVKMPDTQEPVRVRVGMHTGDVVSGLIGSKLPKFSIFGDTMNTCSRMESTGLPGRIHVSETTHNLLCESELWEPTGGVEVKGKGMMQTFLWVPPSPGLPSSNQMLQPIFEETSAESLPSVLIKQTNALLNQLHMPVPAFHPTSQDLPHTESLLPWLNCLSERVVELGYPVSK
ncbi:nucleotide cyclase [Dunaliella salina]|uniref:Nucleotide cyclase n=1 Tax=Dunaliella salina TaxID=3046 RepID=A0ABQ7H9K4_DUNSA|nr:nucleotide cyclase [Dunaliella salina]|eukprot:KAF5843538.1 nucleotide cyclase [Dunaliella salina]